MVSIWTVSEVEGANSSSKRAERMEASCGVRPVAEDILGGVRKVMMLKCHFF